MFLTQGLFLPAARDVDGQRNWQRSTGTGLSLGRAGETFGRESFGRTG